jgi:uncharacterized protein YdeI (YjbR/CyaY-like superfamily)
LLSPDGSEQAGWPVMLKGAVSPARPAAAVNAAADGSEDHSPMRGAATSVVGLIQISAAAKLSTLRVRARCTMNDPSNMPKPSKAKSSTAAKRRSEQAKPSKARGAAKDIARTEVARAKPRKRTQSAKPPRIVKTSPKPASVVETSELAGNASQPTDDLPIITFEKAADWRRWLDRQHKSARGLWVKFARKGSGIASIDRTEAVDGALCYGWIDGQGRSFDEQYYLVKFTPRSPRSIWSKINRVKSVALIEQGLMKPAGLSEVERAQRDGRWDAAYDSPRTAAVPEDLAAALDAHPRARASFAGLNAANRYAILWQLQTAKKPETRTRRIVRFIDMLERGETLH